MKSVDVSVGGALRIPHELQETSRNELSELTGIPRSNISASENDRVNPGVDRAKIPARALTFHAAVLVLPGWDVRRESAAQPVSRADVGLARNALWHAYYFTHMVILHA